MDFLIRDPLHPLLAGGLTKTNMMMEAYTGGCDTGQQIHAVALTPQWKHYVSARPSDARCGTFAPLWTLSYLNTVAALSLTSIST